MKTLFFAFDIFSVQECFFFIVKSQAISHTKNEKKMKRSSAELKKHKARKMPEYYFLIAVHIAEDNRIELTRTSNPNLTLEISPSDPDAEIIQSTLTSFFQLKQHPATFNITQPRESKEEEDDEDSIPTLWFNHSNRTRSQVDINFSFSAKSKTNKKNLLERRLRKVFIHHEIRPLPHQVQLRDKLLPLVISKEKHVQLVFWSLGSGKSFGSLHLFGFIWVPKIIIICSNTMIPIWRDFISQMPQPARTHTEFIIIGLTEFARMAHDESTYFKDQTVIFDEAHLFRNVTENMREQITCLTTCRLLLNLTGTPIINEMDDIIGLIMLHGGKLTSKEMSILKSEVEYDEKVVIDLIDRVFTDRVHFYNPQLQIEHMNEYPVIEMINVHVPMDLTQAVDYMVQKKQNFNIGQIDVGEITICTSHRSAFNTTAKRISNSSHKKQDNKLSAKFMAVCNNVVAFNLYPQLIISSYLDNGIVPICKQLTETLDDKTVKLITGNTDGKQREANIHAYNEGKLDVLGLSKVGDKGLSFFHTKMVHLIDSADNIGTEMQKIYRAARYQSHTRLSDGKMPVVKVTKYISTFPTKEEFVKNSKMIEKYFYEQYCNSKVYSQKELITFDFTAALVDKIETEEGWMTIDQKLEISNQKKFKTIQPIMTRLQELGT